MNFVWHEIKNHRGVRKAHALGLAITLDINDHLFVTT